MIEDYGKLMRRIAALENAVKLLLDERAEETKAVVKPARKRREKWDSWAIGKTS